MYNFFLKSAHCTHTHTHTVAHFVFHSLCVYFLHILSLSWCYLFYIILFRFGRFFHHDFAFVFIALVEFDIFFVFAFLASSIQHYRHFLLDALFFIYLNCLRYFSSVLKPYDNLSVLVCVCEFIDNVANRFQGRAKKVILYVENKLNNSNTKKHVFIFVGFYPMRVCAVDVHHCIIALWFNHSISDRLTNQPRKGEIERGKTKKREISCASVNRVQQPFHFAKYKKMFSYSGSASYLNSFMKKIFSWRTTCKFLLFFSLLRGTSTLFTLQNIKLHLMFFFFFQNETHRNRKVFCGRYGKCMLVKFIQCELLCYIVCIMNWIFQSKIS